MLEIRKATRNDAEVLIDLYGNHLTKYPPKEPQEVSAWQEKIARFESNPHHKLLVGEINGRVVSAVTLVIIENLTNNMRPYAVIENVVTHKDFRGNGYAKNLMQRASEIAEENNCYKIMLLTGSKKESTLRFYENCGFNKNEKTGFIKRFEVPTEWL
ncbi:MAG: GNAT family N-acetyltransferase [Clostridiales bacterium]|jgi:ribosomal protein S18 acetylase RimI-like enzyme|nr:GNAT family N-acetyltransferase [Clostridiales bacterium]